MIENKRNFINLTSSAIVFSAFTALSIFSLSIPSAYADTTGNLDVNVTVPSACSITIAGANSSNAVSRSATINPGDSGPIGDPATVQSLCNDAGGFAVYAVGYTNNTYGSNVLTATIGSGTATIASYATPTGTTPDSSEWNMTITPVSGEFAPTIVNETTGQDPVGNFLQAHEIPSAYTKVAYRNAATDVGNEATGAQFTVAFNAYVATDQPAGAYRGKVKFLLVHPNVLTYDDQTGDPATFAPKTLDSDPEDVPYLQEVSSWGSNVALGETIEAIDARDGQTYAVKRLKMNTAGTETALWMSNLNLGAEELTVTQLDNTNTNLASGVSSISAATFNSWVNNTTWEDWLIDPVVIPITAFNSANGLTGDGNNKFGALYSFGAASAGTVNWDLFDNYPGNLTSDLCPAGWRLPTGHEYDPAYSELITVINAYELSGSGGGSSWNDSTSFTTIQSVLGFSLAGDIAFDRGNVIEGQGEIGAYWSSSYETTNIYDLIFTENNIYTSGGWLYNLDEGGSIRCISDN